LQTWQFDPQAQHARDLKKNPNSQAKQFIFKEQRLHPEGQATQVFPDKTKPGVQEEQSKSDLHD
jgi:hypothetical protein